MNNLFILFIQANLYENTRSTKIKNETPEDQEDVNIIVKAELAPGEFKGLDTTIIKQESFQDNNNNINQKGEFSSSSNANIDLLVSKYIGNPLEEFGKAAVMKLANYGREPRFNKFQGVVEWVNCIFLWVNLEGSTGYSNTFSNEGRHMMWYGGSKMTSGKLNFSNYHIILSLLFNYLLYQNQRLFND